MPDALAPELVALQEAVLGRFSLERELGRGGMGIVFLARDVALDRLVAIKLLPPAQAAQPGLRERFLREARTAAQLSHPNIVPIHLVEEAGDLVFFVMAYVEGETLGQRIRTRGPLAPALGVRMLQEVAWALAYAHLRGIVHRDVKPDNILIENGSNRAMVSDFGIARAGETSGGTSVGEILGTAQFMSPEQACGEKVDGRSDLYSLGIVGYFALSGKLPFEAHDVPALLAMQITKPAPPLSSVAPGIPGKVAQAIDRCLAKAPEDRFPTGEAFADALAQSTAVARETPAPVRVWLHKGEGARRVLVGFTAFLTVGTLVEAVQILFGSAQEISDNVFAIAFPWLVFSLYRILQTQKVIAAGYTFDDLRLAMRQLLEHRKEELAFEYDREPPLWAKAVRKLSFAALGVGAAAVAWLFVPGHGLPDASTFSWILGGASAVAFGGALVGRLVPGKRLKARDSMLEYRLKLLDSPVGRLMQKIATIGLKPTAALGAASHRPTEMAIGMAADQLFESLPKESRKALKDLPALVRRLEAEAQGMRARVDELNAMIAGLGDAAPSAASASLREHQAGAVVSDHREELRRDMTAQRDKALDRLSVAVGALENIRLDLLRLKAGVGTVDQLTADLAAARDLQAEIELAVQANREVEDVLRKRTT